MPANNSVINVLIIDDEKEACDNLENILTQYIDSSINILGVANDAAEAEELIKQTKPDAIFLDIEMPGENAFQFLERIYPYDFEIIFVTAYDEFAIKAFKLNAVDYVLKPVNIDELNDAVARLKEKVCYKHILKHNDQQISALRQIINKEEPQNITLKLLNHLVVVDFRDIYSLEGQGSYCKISINKDGKNKEVVSSSTLSYYEEILPPGLFYRVHKSYLINCMQISEIVADDNHYYILLKNKEKIPISRRRHSDFIRFLKENSIYSG
jgi:two-component system, LytTR family, response regulator